MSPFPIDHDLHCHSFLSSCSSDPAHTPAAILAHAKAHGYTCQCITDHLWDSAVPGASGWYAPQDIEHARRNLPLPQDDSVRMVFGCETEFCGGTKLGLSPANYDAFDFIVIPPDHFHMRGFVRPDGVDTVEKIADLLVTRLEEIAALPLPWHKVGIAHIICRLVFDEGCQDDVYAAVDERRYRAAIRFFAEHGAGIEINCASFRDNWHGRAADRLRLLRLAKEEGCRFYLASDAHHIHNLGSVHEVGPEIVNLLGLDGSDLFRIP